MNEYYKCQNCDQVVQGFVASQQMECCDSPNYVPIPSPDEDVFIVGHKAGCVRSTTRTGSEAADTVRALEARGYEVKVSPL